MPYVINFELTQYKIVLPLCAATSTGPLGVIYDQDKNTNVGRLNTDGEIIATNS